MRKNSKRSSIGLIVSRRRTLIIVLVVAAFVLLLVAGVYLYYRATRRSFVRTIDPTAIQRLTGEIIDIEIPEPLAPYEATEHTWPLTSVKTMTRVVYTSPGPNAILAICGIKRAAVGEDIGQLRIILEALLEHFDVRVQSLHFDKTMPVVRTINGKPAMFEIIEATLPNKRKVYLARGECEGRSGGASLLLVANPAEMSLETIAKMIDSIK